MAKCLAGNGDNCEFLLLEYFFLIFFLFLKPMSAQDLLQYAKQTWRDDSVDEPAEKARFLK